MYVPPRYAVDEVGAWSLVEEVGAGFVVVATSSGIRSVFAPVLVSDDRSRLTLHVSRGNAMWRDASDGDGVVALFAAADSYVSPGLYPNKAVDPRVAPTWDYDVVEVRGTLTVRDDAAFVEDVVRRLTERNEANRSSPWTVDDAPREFTEALLRGIVGLEVAVQSITGAAKLSQNKDEVDRAAVHEAMANGDGRQRALARRMDLRG